MLWYLRSYSEDRLGPAIRSGHPARGRGGPATVGLGCQAEVLIQHQLSRPWGSRIRCMSIVGMSMKVCRK